MFVQAFAAVCLLGAAQEVGPADDLEAAMNALSPGDELVLRGGTYELSGRFGVVALGTSAQPILVRAKDGERPHLHRAGTDQNIVDLDDVSYLTLRGLELSGGSAGLRVVSGDHLTVEDCEIHGTDDVALRANDAGQDYVGWIIRRNHLHHTSGTGEGMYLGCNNDGCRMTGALIEQNYVHHTNGPLVTQGDGIELKEGSSGNIVRDNVIHDTGYPCILVYGVVGRGAPNRIERNALWGCGDHGIQAAADSVVVNNVILGAAADGIAMQPHQSATPSSLTVLHNTVLVAAGGDALSLRGATGSVLIANNALFSQAGNAIYVGTGATAGVVIEGNVGAGGVSGATGGLAAATLSAMAAASYAGVPPMDVFPTQGGALVGAGVVAHVPAEDFNGTARAGVADVGAYAFAAGGNPGWVLATEPKEPPSSSSQDGGASDGGDGDGDGAAGGDGDGGAGGDGDGAGANDADGGDLTQQDDAPSDGGAAPTGNEGVDGGCACGAQSGGATVMLVGLLALLVTGRARRTQAPRARS